MAFGRKKKKDVLIETPEEIISKEPSPMQNLQQETEKEVTPQAQKVVRQVVVELPTKPIREEVIDGTKIVYQTIGELIEENNQLLREIKQLAIEE